MHTSQIPIPAPCSADWRAMKPHDRKRFCDSCKKHVHDLSAMTLAEARAVLASPPLDGLCVRYLHDAHGDIVFQAGPITPTFLVRAKRLAAYAALPVAMAACTVRPSTPPPVMGAPACPLPLPPASSALGGGVPELSAVMGEPPPVDKRAPWTTLGSSDGRQAEPAFAPGAGAQSGRAISRQPCR
jgi:hypothetical protein